MIFTVLGARPSKKWYGKPQGGQNLSNALIDFQMNDQTRVTRKFLLRICGFFTVDKAVHRPTILFEKPFGAKSQPGKKACRPGVGTQSIGLHF